MENYSRIIFSIKYVITDDFIYRYIVPEKVSEIISILTTLASPSFTPGTEIGMGLCASTQKMVRAMADNRAIRVMVLIFIGVYS